MQRLAYFYALAIVVMALCGTYFIGIGSSVNFEESITIALITILSGFIAMIVTIVAYASGLNLSDHGMDEDNYDWYDDVTVSFVRVVFLILSVPGIIFASLSVSIIGSTSLGIIVAIFGVILLISLGHIHQTKPFLDKRIKFI